MAAESLQPLEPPRPLGLLQPLRPLQSLQGPGALAGGIECDAGDGVCEVPPPGEAVAARGPGLLTPLVRVDVDEAGVERPEG